MCLVLTRLPDISLTCAPARVSEPDVESWACNLSMGAACVPEDCVNLLFAKLLDDGDTLKAKMLATKFGAKACSLEQLIHGLVASGEISSALEVAQGKNIPGYSDKMQALIYQLGGNFDQDHEIPTQQQEYAFKMLDSAGNPTSMSEHEKERKSMMEEEMHEAEQDSRSLIVPSIL